MLEDETRRMQPGGDCRIVGGTESRSCGERVVDWAVLYKVQLAKSQEEIRLMEGGPAHQQ